MYKITILLLGVLINSVNAKELSLVVPFERVGKSGLPNATPMQFLIDRAGNLVHYHVGTDRGIKGAFKRKEKIKETDLLKKNYSLFSNNPQYFQILIIPWFLLLTKGQKNFALLVLCKQKLTVR